MREVVTGRGTAGGKRRARSASTAARSKIDRPRPRSFDAGRDVDQQLLLPALDDLSELERGVFGTRISQKPHPNYFFRSISSLEETQPSKWGTSAQFPPSPGERNSRVFSPAWPESIRPAQRAAF